MSSFGYAVPAMTEHLTGQAINVYCDESCHLEHDRCKAMSLGAVWCPEKETRKINIDIARIKMEHGIKKDAEVKWTKISPGNIGLYLELIDYYFDNPCLHFRGVVIPDKSILRHEDFGQTHDEWYYKMYFTLLKAIFRRDSPYYVYIDVKDSHSGENAQKLLDVCANNAYDFEHEIVRRVQPIRSDQVQIMQLVDIFTGAIAFRHNSALITSNTSQAKVLVVNHIIEKANISLVKTTLLSEDKFNLLVWAPYRTA